MLQANLLPIDQDEINAILWKACDTFRGTIDPSEYKNYILVMLFVKYISDVWRERYDELMQEFNDEEYVHHRMRMGSEGFVLPPRSDFYTLYEQRGAANIGELIDEALEAIEEANKLKFQNVFRNISFNSEANLGKTSQRNVRLRHLLEDFRDPRLDLRPSRVGNRDVIGDAYEYMIGRFASTAGKKAGEFYTPPEVSQLLAMLLDPQPGESICDPTCGSGSLLIKCAKQVGSDNYSLWGQEINGGTWALCMMNMFLHNVNPPIIKWGDTLREPQLLDENSAKGDSLMHFNVVVANPPFSQDKWGADIAPHDRYNRFWRGTPPKGKADFAFITHMIETTYRDSNKNGRVGVIAPHGVLFRGSSEGVIRQKLIEENLLDAVIGLPANLFYGTGIPAVILIFKRNKTDNSVIFIDASRDFEPGTNQNRLRGSDIDHIVEIYHTRQSIEKYSVLATNEELANNEFNLNITRYVDTFEREDLVDLSIVQTTIKTLKMQLAEVESKMNTYLQELELND